MLRLAIGSLLLAQLASIPVNAQQIDTTSTDRQIVAQILKECRELYMPAVGSCACADERTRNSAGCVRALKEVPDTFNPFCKSKDVTLNEVRLYRMQSDAFLDRRCAK